MVENCLSWCAFQVAQGSVLTPPLLFWTFLLVLEKLNSAFLKYCQTLIPTWKMVARIYYLIEIILLCEPGEGTFIHSLVYYSRSLKGIEYLLWDQKAGSFPFLLPVALRENLFFIFLSSNDAVCNFFLDSRESVGASIVLWLL